MTEDLPRTIENPLTGERVTFLATAEETNGEYVRIRIEVPAENTMAVCSPHRQSSLPPSSATIR
jgi:hypothetical protein